MMHNPLLEMRPEPEHTLRVLLVEDDVADALFFRAQLERARMHPFHLEHVYSLCGALATLRSHEPRFDVIVLDLGLPDASGTDAVAAISTVAQTIPIVVVTGADDPELARRAAMQSAQDYIVKWEFDPSSLGRTLRYAVERNHLRMQLQAAKERAEDQSRKKSEFVTNLSHEIRSPMAVVVGLTEVLAASTLSTTQREQLSRIQYAGDHLMSLVTNVLDLARVESGHVELASVSFNIAREVAMVAELSRHSATEKGLLLDVVVDPELPTLLLGDPRRLRQVLLNIIGNAVKFTSEGSVRLQVSRAVDTGSSVRIAFTVTDTGPGIPEDRQSQIFEPFVQADASISGKYGGTGLGLSIATSLVALMGGTMSVQSVVGDGTTFQLTVPFSPPLFPALVPHASPEPDSAVEDALRNGAPMKLLLVDDSEDNHQIIGGYLEDLPMKVRSARSGAEAITAFTSERFDLVLLDMHMPTMDGCATARALRSLEFTSGQAHTPIIALSADVIVDSLARATAAGCDSYLSKPLRPQTLMAALANVQARSLHG